MSSVFSHNEHSVQGEATRAYACKNSCSENSDRQQKQNRRVVYIMFALVVIATALGSLSQTASNVMMPHVAAEFGIDLSSAQWLATAYMLAMGVVVPLAAYLLHKLGIRYLLFLALALFAAGAFLDSVATNFALMVIGRILQACSAGIFMPLTQTIAMVDFAPHRRATAMGVSGIALGFAPNIGPTIGGMFAESTGWRSFFVFLLVTTAILFIAVLLFVKKGQRSSKTAALAASFDAWSFVLSAVGFSGVLFAFSMISSFGFASIFFWIPLVVGLFALGWFVLRQRRIDDPLVDMRIFLSRRYVVGFIVLILLFASHLGSMLVIPLFVEDIQSGSGLDAGLVVLPATVAALICNPVAGMLSDKIGVRPVVFVGACFMAAGAGAMVFFRGDEPLYLMMFWQGIRSVGVSSLIGPITSWALSELDPRMVADGSSFTIVVRQAFSSFGTAVMVFIITAASAASVPLFGYQIAFGFIAALALALLGSVVAWVK